MCIAQFQIARLLAFSTLCIALTSPVAETLQHKIKKLKVKPAVRTLNFRNENAQA
jgi:hypothetical protein